MSSHDTENGDGLIFWVREDATTGLPTLQDPDGSLSDDHRRLLEREIYKQFERLAGHRGSCILSLEEAACSDMPHHFKVETIHHEDRRIPSLRLNAIETPPTTDDDETAAAITPPSHADARWQSSFVAEIAELFADLGSDARHSDLNFVLSDLRALLRKSPRQFGLLLLAGYLHVGDEICGYHGAPAMNPYAAAARILADKLGDNLPNGLFTALLPEPAAPDTK